MGGADQGLDLGPSPLVRGSMHKKTVLQHLGPNQYTAPTIHKEVLTTTPNPTPPHPPKMGYPAKGGGEWGSTSKNALGGQFASQNDDVTRGWTCDTIPWGMLRK